MIYDVTGTATEVAAGNTAAMTQAANITVTDDATVAEAAIIYGFNNTTVYAVSDAFSAIQTENAGGSDFLSSATSIAVSDVSGGEKVILTGANAGTAIDFTDDAATLPQAQLVAINSASLALTAADTITVTGATASACDFAQATEIDLLNTGDTITFDSNAAALNATSFEDVFGTNGVLATAGDTVTVTADGTTTVAASEASNVFSFVASGGSNFDMISGLSTADTLNVLTADGTTTGSYLTAAEANAGC